MKIKTCWTLFLPITIINCLTPMYLTSCNSWNKIGEAYFDQYFIDWFNSLTTNSSQNYLDNFDPSINPKIDCAKEDIAIMAFTYDFGGWSVWNKKLHLNNGDIDPNEQDEWFDVQFKIPDINDPFNWKKVLNNQQAKIKGGDYKYLEAALNKGRCGKITMYHGFEIQELELLKQISQLLQINDQQYGQANAWTWQQTEDYWKDSNNIAKLKSSDLTNLKNQILNYNGFCATSIDKNTAIYFLDNFEGSNYFHNKILYEIDVDENTYGGYVSSRHHIRYNRSLGWPHENQLLLSNKLKLFVNDANWITNKNGDNILYLKCKGYHKGF